MSSRMTRDQRSFLLAAGSQILLTIGRLRQSIQSDPARAHLPIVERAGDAAAALILCLHDARQPFADNWEALVRREPFFRPERQPYPGQALDYPLTHGSDGLGLAELLRLLEDRLLEHLAFACRQAHRKSTTLETTFGLWQRELYSLLGRNQRDWRSHLSPERFLPLSPLGLADFAKDAASQVRRYTEFFALGGPAEPVHRWLDHLPGDLRQSLAGITRQTVRGDMVGRGALWDLVKEEDAPPYWIDYLEQTPGLYLPGGWLVEVLCDFVPFPLPEEIPQASRPSL